MLAALSALAHYAAVRLQVVRERWLRRHGDIRGYKARVEVLKNRLAKKRQLLAAARQQMDDPAEVSDLEEEITKIEQDLDALRHS